MIPSNYFYKNKNFLTQTNYSTCYHLGTIFRKFFNNPICEYIEREIKYSNIVYNYEVPTPKFLDYGYSSRYNKHYIDFEYIMLETFQDKNDYSCEVIKKVLDIINKINSIKPMHKDDFWNENRMSDFLKTLNIANEVLSGSTDIDMSILKKLPCDNIIHGDLTETNVCFRDQDVYIVDFESACIGPKIWDKCYFFASVFTNNIPDYIYSFITEEELHVIQIIAKIRYGRALRKQLRVDERAKGVGLWVSMG